MKRRYTVLLADDDKVQTAMLSSQLRTRGYSVAAAYDATYTSMVVMKSPPDVVVLDIQMPGGTGRAVLGRLKANAKTMQIPIIVLSGIADRRVIEEARGLGACDYLVKPVDIDTLEASIRRALGLPESTPSSEPPKDTTTEPPSGAPAPPSPPVAP